MSRYAALSKGLIIKAPFVNWIVEGRKTWELRSSHTQVRGPIALIQQGTGTVVAVAHLIDSVGPLSDEVMTANFQKHAVTPDRQNLPELRKYRHAWVLAEVKRLRRPVPYVHPIGAVKWVSLAPAVIQSVVAESS